MNRMSFAFSGHPPLLPPLVGRVRELLLGIVAMLLVTGALVAPVAAHSLDEVDAMLGDKEKYFQPVDKPGPDFALQTADGRAVGLADLKGKVVVLHFIYTSCPDVCPLHAEKLAEVQKLVNATPMKDRVTFVTVTTDPTNDTAAIMRDYGPTHGLDPANWLFLTAKAGDPEDTTRKLAEQFGHKFQKTADGYQMHGIVTHVIDQEGNWKANFHGLNFDNVNFVTFVNALTNGTSRPHGHAEKKWWDFF